MLPYNEGVREPPVREVREDDDDDDADVVALELVAAAAAAAKEAAVEVVVAIVPGCRHTDDGLIDRTVLSIQATTLPCESSKRARARAR